MTIEIFFPVQPESVDVAGRLHVRAPYALKDTLKAIPLKRWAPLSKCWTYPATEATAHELWNALRGHSLRMDGDAQELFRRAAVGQQVKQADDGDLPDLPGTTPAWLHQKRAFAFARERDGTMLAMDMGTGKSRTAIGLLDEWGSDLAVILCPRSVIGVWPNQFAQHSDRDWLVLAPPNRWGVIKRAAHIERQIAAAGARPVAVIVNYEASWREPMAGLLDGLLTGAAHGVLLLDESHKVKAPGGKAAGYATRLSKAARRRLLLTGTPMPHSPLDLYAQYRALDVDIFGHNFHRFRTRYALLQPIPGTAAQKVVGFQNMDELTRLFASAAFVVKKEDAGLDLPEELHIPDVEVGGRWEGRGVFELEGRSRKAYETIEGDFILGVKDGTVTVANALTKLLRLQQITSGYVRDDDGVDHEVGREKLDVLDELLEDFAEHEPLVIFARFHHDLARITELCEAQGRRVGEVSGRLSPASERWGLNEHSQMRDDIDVCLLQIQSGGVGIDLTRACYAIYYSLDFSLGNYLQSLARVHRPGQTRPVTYYHLIARGTKDEVVYRALRERQDVVEAVLRSARDGEEVPA